MDDVFLLLDMKSIIKAKSLFAPVLLISVISPLTLSAATESDLPHSNSLSPQISAVAPTLYSGLGLNLPTFKISPNSDFQINVTPISTNSTDEGRYITWQWAPGSAPDSVSSTLGIDYFNSGTQHNFVWFVQNAIDMKPASNSTICIKNPPSPNTDGSFNADCWIANPFNNLDTYQIRVSNNPSLGPTWYQATIKDITTGFQGNIGSINVGAQGFNSNLVNPYFQIFDRQNYANCNVVGTQDTLISDIFSNGRDLGAAKTINYNTCVNYSISASKDIKGTLVKFGGLNPKDRKVILPRL